MTEQFELLLKKEKQQQWLDALRQLSPEQKKELAPTLKSWIKEYSEYKELKGGRFGCLGTETQNRMLASAAFICFNQAAFEKTNFFIWTRDPSYLLPVIDWYCPTWFSNFCNKQGTTSNNIWFFFSYTIIMDLAQKGHVQPSPELLARLLPLAVRVEQKKHQWHYRPGNLFKYPVTLAEHIWYLFQFESTVHLPVGDLFIDNKGTRKEIEWLDILQQLLAEGHISRQRLLQESLLAINCNFSQTASAWFAGLFASLKPSIEEILSLQPELLNVLHSPHSKPINTALGFLKKAAGEPGFNKTAFLDETPVLLSSGTKSIVTAALMIMEKLAKNDPSLRKLACELATGAFIHADESLQSKAAKLIYSYRQTLDGSFHTIIAPYAATMMQSARTLLQDGIPGAGIAPPLQAEPASVTPANHPIPFPESIDDLAFLASQAFNNNQSWHFDVLPAALLRFQPQLKGDIIHRLEPALQCALQLNKYNFSQPNQGMLDQLLAVFFIDCCRQLLPLDAGGVLQQLFDRYTAELTPNERFYYLLLPQAAHLQAWKAKGHHTNYEPFKQLLLSALDKFKTGSRLPLLSTPTHEPAWIAPEVLVQRLAAYQQAAQTPDMMDWQIAIARCRLLQTEQAIALAHNKLRGEYLRLCLFLLGQHALPEGPFEHPSAWMVASLALPVKKQYAAFNDFGYYQKPFSYYTAEYHWEVAEEIKKEYRYNDKRNRTEPVDVPYKVLQLQKPVPEPLPAPRKTNLFQKLVAGLSAKPMAKLAELTLPPLLYDYRSLNTHYAVSAPNDTARRLLLSPGHPGPMLSVIFSTCLRYGVFESGSFEQVVQMALQCLHDAGNPLTANMEQQFVAASMLSSGKTARSIAGEVWLQAVNLQGMVQEQAGTMLAQLVREEFAPLKRFTDLVEQQLFRVSAMHNRQLQLLLEMMLAQLPDAPVKGLKKLLEQYTEILAANQPAITTEAVLSKLAAWQQTSGLQKTIAVLEKQGKQ